MDGAGAACCARARHGEPPRCRRRPLGAADDGHPAGAASDARARCRPAARRAGGLRGALAGGCGASHLDARRGRRGHRRPGARRACR
nr:hypothetical protein [Angustibacter aerolatus]